MTAVRKLAAQPAPAVTLPVRPTDIAVSMILDGRVGRGTVASRLPYDLSERAVFVAADRMPSADATLEAVREIATRCVPWVCTIVGPQLWLYAAPGEDLTAYKTVRASEDGRIMVVVAGLASRRAAVPDDRREVILLSGGSSTIGVVATLHHEVFHLLEYYLHEDDLAVVNAAVGAGRELPGDYLDSLIERRARVYEAWASAYDEGWRPTALFGIPLSRLDRVFLSVYHGDVAADRVAGRPSQARLLPGERALRVVVGFARQAWDELGWQGVLAAGVAGLILAHHV